MVDKPSVTNKPNRPVTPKKPLDIDVRLDMNTDNLSAKLKSIAKHTEALAKELDAIDNAIVCERCGGTELDGATFYAEGHVKYHSHTECKSCGHTVSD